MAEIRDTIDYLHKNKRNVLGIITFFGLGLVISSGLVYIGLPVYADRCLLAGSRGYGWLTAAVAAGIVIGAVIIGKYKVKSYECAINIGWAGEQRFYALL